jgi:predicted branched-subunit amino acid permease
MSKPGRVHVGKRGRVLLFFGLLDLVYAVSLAAPGAQSRTNPFFIWLAQIAPWWVWAVFWAAVSALCLWNAFRRRDAVGFAAAIALKVCWGIVSLGAWVFGDVERGYVSAAIWLGLAWLVGVLAGWPEPGDSRGPTWISPSS